MSHFADAEMTYVTEGKKNNNKKQTNKQTKKPLRSHNSHSIKVSDQYLKYGVAAL